MDQPMVSETTETAVTETIVTETTLTETTAEIHKRINKLFSEFDQRQAELDLINYKLKELTEKMDQEKYGYGAWTFYSYEVPVGKISKRWCRHCDKLTFVKKTSGTCTDDYLDIDEHLQYDNDEEELDKKNQKKFEKTEWKCEECKNSIDYENSNTLTRPSGTLLSL